MLDGAGSTIAEQITKSVGEFILGSIALLVIGVALWLLIQLRRSFTERIDDWKSSTGLADERNLTTVSAVERLEGEVKDLSELVRQLQRQVSNIRYRERVSPSSIEKKGSRS